MSALGSIEANEPDPASFNERETSLRAEAPRVLIVAESGDAGGIGRYCIDLAEALRGLAAVVCLCATPCRQSGDCWLSGHCSARNIRLHKIPTPRKGWRTGRRGLADLWRQSGRPIIHVNGRRGNSLALVMRIVLRRFRYVTTVHGMLGLHSRRNVVYRIIDLAATRLARTVIAVSEHGRVSLIRVLSPRHRTITIPNGLAPADLRHLLSVAEARQARIAVRRPATIGFLGRLSPEKGTRELLEIARLLSLAGADVSIHIAGDGPDRPWLLEHPSASSVAVPMRWVGTITDTASFLGDIDILLIPSHNEGMPYVLLEGMAAGCAVVAFGVGGIPEVISHPGLGVLIVPGDVEGMASAVRRLAEDPGLLSAIGQAASSHVATSFALTSRLDLLRDAYGLDRGEGDRTSVDGR